MTVSYPTGIRMIRSWIWAASAAAMIAGSSAPGTARAMFSRTVPCTSWVSWKTNPTWRYNSSNSISRMSFPPMRIAPSSTSWNRASSDASVDFPDPLGPTNAVTVPGSNSRFTSRTTGTPSTYEKVMLSKLRVGDVEGDVGKRVCSSSSSSVFWIFRAALMPPRSPARP